MIALPKDLHDVVRRAGEEPVRLTDVETRAEYVVVPAKFFDELMSGLRRKVFSREEQIELIVATGLRAGWDNAELDIYNDVEPQ
jgi:propanediol dehydratase small subunit